MVRKIYIGMLEQCVLYEGINALCFSCGRIGHKLDACPYTVREQHKEQSKDRCEGHNEMPSTREEDRLKEKEKDKSQEDYGEWMVVSRKKVNSKTKPVQHSLEMNHTADVQLTQTSSATAAKSRVAGQYGRNGKRKALHTQSAMSQKETNVMAMSSQSQPKIGKGTKDKGVRAQSNQKVTNLVGLQSNVVGQSKNSGVFVFGSEAELGLFCFSSSFNTKTNPKDKLIYTGKESSVSKFSSSSDGRQREMGDFLQGKGDSNGGRDNLLDKARPNRGMGLARAQSNGGVEEPILVNGEKQVAGVFADERQSMDHDSEPVVEVLDGLTSNAGASSDKLKAISHRIRHAELGKISVRSGNRVDRAKGHKKEEIANHSDGMLVDGQSTQGENDSIC